jgi:molybdopterin synthase sulfur carrier subunit
MVRVLFFASYREQLNTRQLALALDAGSCTVAELMARMIADGGPAFQQVLHSDNLVIAVNQTICDQQQRLQDGDELAFYPPVTGG